MLRNVCSLLAIAIALMPSRADGPAIRLNQGKKGAEAARFEVAGLASADLERLGKIDLRTHPWQGLFAVYVVSNKSAKDDKNQPAIIGTLRVVGDLLCFEPRFPLIPGVRYQAIFRPALLDAKAGGADVRVEFALPKAKRGPPTAVTHVYPSRDKLPENQLKFYLHFSAPMSRGEAYRHVRLLDEAGKPVDDPFLELDEELWDPEGQRFTLFFDPGRIKRGLKPREEVGPALVEGKSYTLLIDRRWQDATGTPLRETYRKQFRVIAPDDTPIDPNAWKIEPPNADTVVPLTVSFPESLDHALLQRLLWITDTQGERVTGTVHVTGAETCWRFTPKRPWPAGRYTLMVDTSLEDLAGNQVGQPFEVDVLRPIRREVKTAMVKRPFEIKAARGK